MKNSDTISKGQLHGHLIVESVHAITGEVLDRWEKKNAITIQSEQALISGVSIPTSNSTISKITIGTDLGELMTGNPNVTFTNPSTIVRSAGSWLTDGFQVGDFLTIKNSTSGLNDTSPTLGTPVLQILTVNATTIVLGTGSVTLNGNSYTLGSVVTQSAASGVLISRGNILSPSAPQSSYTQATMASLDILRGGTVLFAAPYVLGAHSIDSTTASFNVTIIGQDVLNAVGGTSQIFTSAMLLTGNGNCFAYQRFPQKSLSSVVNVNITWQIGF